MDHLNVLIQNSEERQVAIPYVAGAYDGSKSFDDFHKEWQEQRPRFSVSNSAREALFQEWLFFSFIAKASGALNIALRREDFIKSLDADGSKWITTAIFTSWKTLAPRLPTPAVWEGRLRARVRDYNIEITSMLNTACAVVLEECPDLDVDNQESVRFDIWLSICVLLETINEVTCKLTGAAQPLELTLPHPRFVESRMLRNHWCRSRIVDFLPYDISCGYVATLLATPAEMDMEDHSKCLAEKCFWSMARGERLRPAHHTDCAGTCQELKVDTAQIESIIEAGQVPLIRLEHENGLVSLSVIASTPVNGVNYAAISHVWSQGLGNKLANSLPSCQMIVIANMVNVDLPIWIDTLCIPTRPPVSESSDDNLASQARARKCKLMAISQMNSIYGAANVVLVLDNFLQLAGAGIYERRLSFLSSEWTRRLWTLQEGTVNFDKVQIRFKDSFMSLEQLLRKDDAAFGDIAPGPERNDRSVVSRLLDEDINGQLPFEYINDFIDPDSTQVFSLMGLITNMHRRVTTRAEDEFACVMSMLGLDLSAYKDLSMSNLLKHIQDIPQDLIFCGGERLTMPGLRWAPTSFLQQRHPVVGDSIDGRLVVDKEDSAITSFVICKPTILLLDPFDFVPRTEDLGRNRYLLIDIDPRNPALLFRAIHEIDPASPHLRSRFLGSTTKKNGGSKAPGRATACPAALILADTDTVATAVRAPGCAVLMSGISSTAHHQGRETVYTGDYEVLLWCGQAEQAPKDILEAATTIRAKFIGPAYWNLT